MEPPIRWKLAYAKLVFDQMHKKIENFDNVQLIRQKLELGYIVQYQPTKFVHAHLSILDSEDHWNSPNTMNITLPNISIGKRYVQYR